jgi:L-fuculose-phosphate aldolase
MHDEVLAAAAAMLAQGLTTGTAGNVSARDGDTIVITSAGEKTRTATLALDGSFLDGAAPSSERALHAAIYRAYPDVRAVVHTHSPYATAFACARRPIPAALDEFVHYVGGGDVPCADYAPSGTGALGDAVVPHLADRFAVLLANHGVVTIGGSPDLALRVAAAVERGAHAIWAAQALGGAVPIRGT